MPGVDTAANCGRLPPVTATEVLVVEDAPEFAQLATDVLTDAGYRVRCGHHVGRCPDRHVDVDARSRRPRPRAPDGDGLDLCRTIREHSNAYVIVVSGRSE